MQRASINREMMDLMVKHEAQSAELWATIEELGERMAEERRKNKALEQRMEQYKADRDEVYQEVQLMYESAIKVRPYPLLPPPTTPATCVRCEITRQEQEDTRRHVTKLQVALNKMARELQHYKERLRFKCQVKERPGTLAVVQEEEEQEEQKQRLRSPAVALRPPYPPPAKSSIAALLQPCVPILAPNRQRTLVHQMSQTDETLHPALS